jgi:hypothetical protein
VSIGHVHGVRSRRWSHVVWVLQRLDLLVQLLRPVVLLHWRIRRHHLAWTRILRSGLSNRRSTIFRSGLAILDMRLLLTDWGGLFVVRLLIVLVWHVAIRLSHVHSTLTGVDVLGLWGLRIGSLGRLHQGSCGLRRSKLTLVRVLTRSIWRHLRVAGTLGRRHLLIGIVGLVALGHIIDARATRGYE